MASSGLQSPRDETGCIPPPPQQSCSITDSVNPQSTPAIRPAIPQPPPHVVEQQRLTTNRTIMTRTVTSLLLLLLLLAPGTAFGQQTVVVTDDDVTGEVTWTSDNVYILDGRVFAEEGTVLTIES